MLAFHNQKANASRRLDRLIAAALRAGIWEVSPDGRVFSNRGARKVLGSKNTKGYLVATLHFKGKRAQVKLHRVVWISYNGLIPYGLLPDHENRVRDDNRPCNLRLVDCVGNAANRRSYAGENNPAAKITARRANAIRNASGSYSQKASRFGVSKSLVAQISRGELWS